MIKNVHQILAGASKHDAITKYAVKLKNILSSNYSCEIFAPLKGVEKSLQNIILPIHKINEYSGNESSLIYHYSIGSFSTDYYKKFHGKKILCYHNITPFEFFLPYSDAFSTLLREGRDELCTLASITDVAISDSDYNKNELKNMGFKNVITLPLFMDENLNEVLESNKIKKDLSKIRYKFLFVGRVVPNKGFLNLLKVFSLFHNFIDNNSMLYCIGKKDVVIPYFNFLESKIDEFNIKNSVVFTGNVKDCELISYYKNCSAFLCFSEHEGFCIPLLESMNFNLPVFALNKTAVPETLHGTGILINEVNTLKIAELIYEILTNNVIYNEICEKQKNRALYFSMENFKKRLLDFTNSYL